MTHRKRIHVIHSPPIKPLITTPAMIAGLVFMSLLALISIMLAILFGMGAL